MLCACVNVCVPCVCVVRMGVVCMSCECATFALRMLVCVCVFLDQASLLYLWTQLRNEREGERMGER